MNLKGCLCAFAMSGAVAAAGAFAPAAQAEQYYTLGSITPGTTPFIVNTAWSKAVNKYVPGVTIRVSAVGPGTRHQLLASEGKMDFFMWAPIGYMLMYRQIGPFKKLTDGPARTRRMATIFSYRIGVSHFVVYADSGIKALKDIKGKRVFLGSPGSVATRNATQMVEAMTGYKPGVDFSAVKMGFAAARDAFQDKKFDVWSVNTNAPSPAIQQLALTSKIRLLSLDPSKFDHPLAKKILHAPGITTATIMPGTYGANQVNTEPVTAFSVWVGLAARLDIPDETVYAMTKAFWEHIDEAHQMAPWMKGTVNLETALAQTAGRVHPGAAKYYREIGLKIPPSYNLDKK